MNAPACAWPFARYQQGWHALHCADTCWVCAVMMWACVPGVRCCAFSLEKKCCVNVYVHLCHVYYCSATRDCGFWAEPRASCTVHVIVCLSCNVISECSCMCTSFHRLGQGYEVTCACRPELLHCADTCWVRAAMLFSGLIWRGLCPKGPVNELQSAIRLCISGYQVWLSYCNKSK